MVANWLHVGTLRLCLGALQKGEVGQKWGARVLPRLLEGLLLLLLLRASQIIPPLTCGRKPEFDCSSSRTWPPEVQHAAYPTMWGWQGLSPSILLAALEKGDSVDLGLNFHSSQDIYIR